MADKIVEILESGSLRKVGQVCESEKAQVINLFNRVWGAGPASAEMWYQQVNTDFQTINWYCKDAKFELLQASKYIVGTWFNSIVILDISSNVL